MTARVPSASDRSTTLNDPRSAKASAFAGGYGGPPKPWRRWSAERRRRAIAAFARLKPARYIDAGAALAFFATLATVHAGAASDRVVTAIEAPAPIAVDGS